MCGYDSGEGSVDLAARTGPFIPSTERNMTARHKVVRMVYYHQKEMIPTNG
jgi:hypothetical protein